MGEWHEDIVVFNCHLLLMLICIYVGLISFLVKIYSNLPAVISITEREDFISTSEERSSLASRESLSKKTLRNGFSITSSWLQTSSFEWKI